MTAANKSERTLAGLTHSSGLAIALTVAALVVGITAMLPLLQSSGATSTAGDVQQMELQKDEMQARLRELEVEVAKLGSLGRIEHEARTRLQMEEPKEPHYIAVEAQPPAKRKLPSRYLPPEQAPREDESSLVDDVIGWLLP